MANILKFPTNKQICFRNKNINIRRLAKHAVKNYTKGMPFEIIQSIFLEKGIYVSRIYTLQHLLRTTWKHRVLHRLGKAAKKKGLVFPLHRILYSELPPHMISFECLEYYSIIP